MGKKKSLEREKKEIKSEKKGERFADDDGEDRQVKKKAKNARSLSKKRDLRRGGKGETVRKTKKKIASAISRSG